jgi:hypothetical protein
MRASSTRSGSGTAVVLRLFLSRLFSDRQVWVLPVVAFAVVGSLALTVAGGASFFWSLPEDVGGLYRILAAFAVMFLVAPMAGLAASASKLLARRRDERLSSLRLLGASSVTVRSLAITEAVVLAATGSLLGVVGYLALMPLVGLLRFAGGPIGVGGMWLGVPGLLAVLAVLLLVALLSSIGGLRRIEITPLGVRTRQTAARVHRLTVVVAVVGVLIAQVLARVYGIGDLAVATTLLLAAFGVPMLALNLLGPWVILVVARRRWRRARGAEELVAARDVLESPRQAWRQVGGVALTTYVGVVGGAGLALAGSAGSGSARPEDLILLGDLRSGVLLTMMFSFVLAACAVGITQTALVLDRGPLYLGLSRLGMTADQLHRIRRRAVLGSLRIVLGVTVAVAVVTTLPVLGMALVLSPTSVLVIVVCLAAGVGLVRLGVTASRPALRTVLEQR